MADTLLAGQRHTHELPPEERESYRVAIERFCFINDMESILEAAGVQHAYRFRRPYPQDPLTPGAERVEIPWKPGATLLGRRIGFPVGVPASVLTADSRWIGYFHDQGFNVITFKTVRSRLWEPLPYPNWVFLDDADAPLPLGAKAARITMHGDSTAYLRHLRAFSMANSFGVPSKKPEAWAIDLRRALEVVRPGATLMVSVMGSTERGDPSDALVDDFARVARLALDAGAPAIELNLSCPNTLDLDSPHTGVKAPLCESVEDTLRVAKAVADEIDCEVPLVAKLGYLPFAQLKQMVAALSPHVSAFSGINTFQVRIESRRGAPTFGHRDRAGVSGIALRRLALDFVRSLDAVRRELDLDYEILGMGGVMDAADVFALLASGADAVQTASAAAINPNLPAEIAAFGASDAAGKLRLVDETREILQLVSGAARDAQVFIDRLGVTETVARYLEAADELDLPRLLLTLLGSHDLADEVHEPLDESVWGPAPSRKRVRNSEKQASALLQRQHDRLLVHLMSTDEFAERVGWSTDQVRAAADSGDIIYYKLQGRLFLPNWQFVSDERSDLLPELRTLRQYFGGDVAALGVWIESPAVSLNNRTPRQALAEGDTETVLDSIATIALAV